MQHFEYSRESEGSETAIAVYNDSIGTESSRLLGIMVSNRKCYLYRKLLPYIIRIKLRFDKDNDSKAIHTIRSGAYRILSKIHKNQDKNTRIYPFSEMVDMVGIENGDKITETGFIPIKSHEMRTIVIPKDNFLKAVKNRLMRDKKALKRFVDKKPVYIYFLYQTMGGKIKEFVIETNYQDTLGKDLKIADLANTLKAQEIYK
ncbi:hypothetical protein [Levilactobacillus brevis]|uniref:hypothetical protein n=1 Tax=Levilactobacillus brevis TaxID=1580 RepID=UPI0020322FD2|nr:hypothetical protein [Levilactobacillus brevis]